MFSNNAVEFDLKKEVINGWDILPISTPCRVSIMITMCAWQLDDETVHL